MVIRFSDILLYASFEYNKLMISNTESKEASSTTTATGGVKGGTIIQQQLERESGRLSPTSKVTARDVVLIRGATGEENPPLIVSLPRKILNAAGLRKGDEVRIFTDGVRVYLEKLEEPEI
jgi:hypothetical protein